MKKLVALVALLGLGWISLTTYALPMKQMAVIDLGVVEKPNSPNQANWRAVCDAISKGLHQKTILTVYKTDDELTKNLVLGKVSIAYLADLSSPLVLGNKNIKLLAHAVRHDPVTGVNSLTYEAYVLTAKNSLVHSLSGLKHKKIAYYNILSTSDYLKLKQTLAEAGIQPVQWVAYPNIDEAFEAVHDGRASAISVWSYVLLTRNDQENYKIIAEFKDLKNPALYINMQHVEATMLPQLKANLAHVKGPHNIVGFR